MSKPTVPTFTDLSDDFFDAQTTGELISRLLAEIRRAPPAEDHAPARPAAVAARNCENFRP